MRKQGISSAFRFSNSAIGYSIIKPNPSIRNPGCKRRIRQRQRPVFENNDQNMMLLALYITSSCNGVNGCRLIEFSDIFPLTEILNRKSEYYVKCCYIEHPLYGVSPFHQACMDHYTRSFFFRGLTKPISLNDRQTGQLLTYNTHSVVD